MLEQRPKRGISGRPLALLVFFVVCFVVIAFRLWSLQIIQAEKFKRLSIRNSIRTFPLKPRRGNIYDRTGILLAGNRIRYDASVFFSHIYNRRDRTRVVEVLSEVLGISVERIRSAVSPSKIIPYIPTKVAKDIKPEQFYELKMLESSYPGLMCEIEPVRIYKYNQLLCHVFGYVGQISSQKWKQLKKSGDLFYQMDDILGQGGLEKVFEEHLRGRKGSKSVVVDNRGRINETLKQTEPESGADIFLTIDLALQQKCEQMLEGRRGSIVAVDPRNGDILAMASTPGFDPNLFTGSRTKDVVQKIKTLYNPPDKSDKPLYNRALSVSYPLGSAFKAFVALAGLEHPDTATRIGPDKIYTCRGSYRPAKFKSTRYWHCYRNRSHDQLDLTHAIQKSCNVYFYQLAYHLGRDAICNMAGKFGFGAKTGLDLPGEISGINPSRENYTRQWYGGDILQIGIGQFPLEVTPLQVALAYSAIANGGTLYKPRLVVEIKNRDIVERFDPSPKTLDIRPESLEAVREGLKLVTLPGGTAGTVFKGFEYLKAAGKTSTAEYGKEAQANHAWFVCFAPHDQPVITLITLIERGETGGKTAAPIAREILTHFFGPRMEVEDDK